MIFGLTIATFTFFALALPVSLMLVYMIIVVLHKSEYYSPPGENTLKAIFAAVAFILGLLAFGIEKDYEAAISLSVKEHELNLYKIHLLYDRAYNKKNISGISSIEHTMRMLGREEIEAPLGNLVIRFATMLVISLYALAVLFFLWINLNIYSFIEKMQEHLLRNGISPSSNPELFQRISGALGRPRIILTWKFIMSISGDADFILRQIKIKSLKERCQIDICDEDKVKSN